MREAVKAVASENEVHAIMRCLVKRACEGDVQAAREVFDRLFGRPDFTSATIRLDQLEAMFSSEFTASDGPADR